MHEADYYSLGVLGGGTSVSIRDRVEDALVLWKNGRLEGAFLIALIAISASARRRYPRVGDRESFEQFLTDSHTVRISVEYRGTCYPVEHVFYKWLRCNLVHEGELPVDIEIMPDSEPGTMSVRAGGAPEYVLKISEGWFHHLVGAVMQAPENTDLFSIDGEPE